MACFVVAPSSAPNQLKLSEKVVYNAATSSNTASADNSALPATLELTISWQVGI